MLRDHWQYQGADRELTGLMLDFWRAHCHRQALPLELPRLLSQAGFGGVSRDLFTFLHTSLHGGAYAFWAAKLVAAFSAGQGIPEEKVGLWLDQLVDADREGRLGFFNASVVTRATALA